MSPAVSTSGADPATDPRPVGLLALTLAQFCFGLFPLFGKWAFTDGAFTPAAVASYRVVTGAAVLTLLAFLVHGRRALPAGGDLARLFCCGLCGVALNQGLFLEGLSRTTSVNAGLAMCLIPVFTYAVAVGVRLERLSGRRSLGIAIALVGVAGLFIGQGGALFGEYVLGNLLVVANAFCYSIYLVISKPLTRRYPPLVIIAWVYLFALVSLPYFAANERLIPELAGTTRAWWSLAYILVFPTVLGYLLKMLALSRVSASTTAFFSYVQPLIAGAAGVAVLGEALSRGTVLAAAGLFAGMWLVVRRDFGR